MRIYEWVDVENHTKLCLFGDKCSPHLIFFLDKE